MSQSVSQSVSESVSQPVRGCIDQKTEQRPSSRPRSDPSLQRLPHPPIQEQAEVRPKCGQKQGLIGALSPITAAFHVPGAGKVIGRRVYFQHATAPETPLDGTPRPRPRPTTASISTASRVPYLQHAAAPETPLDGGSPADFAFFLACLGLISTSFRALFWLLLGPILLPRAQRLGWSSGRAPKRAFWGDSFLAETQTQAQPDDRPTRLRRHQYNII